jgi:predicted nucleotide-binding protein/predicted transcriptional regulator
MTIPSVFISYSRKDEEWKDRLVTHLSIFEHEGILSVWEDQRIQAGDEWYSKIHSEINRASIAIIMVSANYLNSKFLLNEEVPRLLQRREEEGLRILPVIVKPCEWTQVGWLSRFQVWPRNGKPIASKTNEEIDADFAALAREIASLVRHIEASDDAQKQEIPMLAASKKISNDAKRNVFVVHGRNESLRRSIFDFLRTIGLNPIEWTQAIAMTGQGSPFIGDVLDKAMEQAQAIVVLLTGDDDAKLKEEFQSAHDPDYEKQLTSQARPNVLFEAGMAFGKYPNRTILIQVGWLRPFSDIGGRHIIHLKNSQESRQVLVQRLIGAGCSVNTSGTDWLTAGEFTITEAGSKADTKKIKESKEMNILDIKFPADDLLASFSQGSNLDVTEIKILIVIANSQEYGPGGASIVFIAKLTNLNPVRVEHYCETLNEKEFVHLSAYSSRDGQIYTISPKGRTFLIQSNLI